MTHNQRAELTKKIRLFLVGKGFDALSTWEGRLTKEQQLDAFGIYFGRGLLVVNGIDSSITMIVFIAFSQDFVYRRGITADSEYDCFAWDEENMSSFRDYCKANNIKVTKSITSTI